MGLFWIQPHLIWIPSRLNFFYLFFHSETAIPFRALMLNAVKAEKRYTFLISWEPIVIILVENMLGICKD